MPLTVYCLIPSLKKTANAPSTVWSAGQALSIKFAQRTIGKTEHGGEIPLRSLAGSRGSSSEL